jgi:hypothetical protein
MNDPVENLWPNGSEKIIERLNQTPLADKEAIEKDLQTRGKSLVGLFNAISSTLIRWSKSIPTNTLPTEEGYLLAIMHPIATYLEDEMRQNLPIVYAILFQVPDLVVVTLPTSWIGMHKNVVEVAEEGIWQIFLAMTDDDYTRTLMELYPDALKKGARYASNALKRKG